MTKEITRTQYRALEGLAHWCYQAARCTAENDAEGSEQARQTLATFPAELDALNIPWWIQNAVSVWAQDFRAPGNIREAYLDQLLKRRGVSVVWGV